MTTGGGIDNRELDSPVRNLIRHGGKVVVSTQTAVWLLGGRSDPASGTWLGEPEPVNSHGTYSDSDDFIFPVSFGGKFYTWLGGQVMEWNPNAGASKQGWRAVGAKGRTCYWRYRCLKHAGSLASRPRW